uniref:Putative endonuclease-reverse transcriptase n=1 Tax=Rhipicephalus microplus TaxID=6941 RepID=A0A6G5AGC3_RHIMP
MKASNATDKIELVELSRLINRRKIADIRSYNVKRVEQAENNGRSLKAVKADLCIGENLMYALRNKEGNVITNMHRIVEMAKEFYRELYSSQKNQDDIVKTSMDQRNVTSYQL